VCSKVARLNSCEEDLEFCLEFTSGTRYLRNTGLRTKLGFFRSRGTLKSVDCFCLCLLVTVSILENCESQARMNLYQVRTSSGYGRDVVFST
jgi:hypothetical protein